MGNYKDEIWWLIEMKHEHPNIGPIAMWLCTGENCWTNDPNAKTLQKFKTKEDGEKAIKGTLLEKTCIVTEHMWTSEIKEEKKHLCKLCLTPMPEGEEMFMYHGYSCNCPETKESHIEKLAKLNDFETIGEYYQYMIDSYNNGQPEQCKQFYEQMLHTDKLMFLSYLIDRIFFEKKDFEFCTMIKKFLTFSL